MPTRCCFALVVAGAVALVAAACGGERADLTDRDISDDELADMVLIQEELGTAYADFTLNEEGFTTNEEEAEGGFDPEGEAEDAERFGRIIGYHSFYSPSGRHGVTAVGTTVTLFRDAGGAAGNLRDSVDDCWRAVGMTSDGVRLEDVEEFELGEVGDEALGLVMTASDESGQELSAYYAAFRLGRLMGIITIGRVDEEDVREEVGALARKLEERMLNVLREGADG